MTKHQSPQPKDIKDPILAKHAVQEFGFSWKWLRPRLKSGKIHWMKVGRYLVLNRNDIEREYRVTRAGIDLVKKAQAAHHRRVKRRGV